MSEKAELTVPVKAALFDCDGLLVETERLFTEAEGEIFARRGLEFTAEHKRQILGRSLPELGEIVASILREEGAGPKIADELLTRMLELVSTPMEPLPGVLELLEALEGRAIRVVVSNSPRKLVETTLRSSGLASKVEAAVTVEDVARPKPNPDLYLEAARIAGFAADDCLALEDSPTGVRAARAAGIRVLGVPAQVGVNIGATWHVSSLGDSGAQLLLQKLFDLPESLWGRASLES